MSAKGKRRFKGGLLCCLNECENHILECEGVEQQWEKVSDQEYVERLAC